MNKRQRSANFDEEDRNRLLDLIETSGKKEVLESKLKDSATLRKKREMWKEIVTGFNATCQRRRNEKQLQELWCNIRKKAKKDHSAQRRSFFRTGGGPSDATIMDDISPRAAVLLGSSTIMEPLSDISDDDDVIPKINCETATNKMTLKDESRVMTYSQLLRYTG